MSQVVSRTYKPRKNAKKQAVECKDSFICCFEESETLLNEIVSSWITWINGTIKKLSINSVKELNQFYALKTLTSFQYFLLLFYGPWKIDWSKNIITNNPQRKEEFCFDQGFSDIPGSIIWSKSDSGITYRIVVGNTVALDIPVIVQNDEIIYIKRDLQNFIARIKCRDKDDVLPKQPVWWNDIYERIICIPTQWVKDIPVHNIYYISPVLFDIERKVKENYSKQIFKPYNISLLTKEKEQTTISFLAFKSFCPDYSTLKLNFFVQSGNQLPETLTLNLEVYSKKTIERFNNFMIDKSIDQNIELEELKECICFSMETSCEPFALVCLELWTVSMLELMFKDYETFESMWIEITKWENNKIVKDKLLSFFNTYIVNLSQIKILHLWYLTSLNKSLFSEKLEGLYNKFNKTGGTFSLYEQCYISYPNPEFMKWLFLSVLFKNHPILKSSFLSILKLIGSE